MIEITHMLVLSTSHLTPEACNEYLKNNVGPWYEKDDYGWFVAINTLNNDTEVDLPLSLDDCLEFAIDEGCDWIMFDRDGPVIEELTTYEW